MMERRQPDRSWRWMMWSCCRRRVVVELQRFATADDEWECGSDWVDDDGSPQSPRWRPECRP